MSRRGRPGPRGIADAGDRPVVVYGRRGSLRLESARELSDRPAIQAEELALRVRTGNPWADLDAADARARARERRRLLFLVGVVLGAASAAIGLEPVVAGLVLVALVAGAVLVGRP